MSFVLLRTTDFSLLALKQLRCESLCLHYCSKALVVKKKKKGYNNDRGCQMIHSLQWLCSFEFGLEPSFAASTRLLIFKTKSFSWGKNMLSVLTLFWFPIIIPFCPCTLSLFMRLCLGFCCCHLFFVCSFSLLHNDAYISSALLRKKHLKRVQVQERSSVFHPAIDVISSWNVCSQEIFATNVLPANKWD